MSSSDSLSSEYFDALYKTNPDPWKFETSQYEADKYNATIAALPRSSYTSALEIGGSIGVLTEKLAHYCDALLSIDVSEIAQARAIARCQHLPQVHFQIMRIPEKFPDAVFDLILVSEVAYYLGWDDFRKMQRQIVEHLKLGGHLLIVHWILEQDYPLTGDQVHDSLLSLDELDSVLSQRTEKYRLDLLERI